MQKELRLLKKNVGLAMKEVRSSYTAQKATVQAVFFSSLAGRKTAGRNRALKRENLRRQELTSLAPYQSVNSMIDGVLVELDGAKLKLENWMAEHK
jgi:hypothetical protein